MMNDEYGDVVEKAVVKGAIAGLEFARAVVAAGIECNMPIERIQEEIIKQIKEEKEKINER